jgi:hypothetical protein
VIPRNGVWKSDSAWEPTDVGRDPTLNVRNPTLNVQNGSVNVKNTHREVQKSLCEHRRSIAEVSTPTECVSTTETEGHNPDMLGLRLSPKSPDTEKKVGETFLIHPGQGYTRHLIAGCPGSLEFSRSHESGRTRRERDVEAERRASTADERPG